MLLLFMGAGPRHAVGAAAAVAAAVGAAAAAVGAAAAAVAEARGALRAVAAEVADLCGNQPLVWGVPTKLQNSLSQSNRSRFG